MGKEKKNGEGRKRTIERMNIEIVLSGGEIIKRWKREWIEGGRI